MARFARRRNSTRCLSIAPPSAVAKRHGLKVVYDAAHAVGVTYKGKSVFTYGDVSTTSFHATKLLNTSEGGGVFSTDPEVDRKVRELRFFGYNAEKDVDLVGTNAKMTEVNAAIGLANLRYLSHIVADRKAKYGLYRSLLAQNPTLAFQKIDPSCNCSYFPVIFDSEATLLRVEAALRRDHVFARRYFYPSVNTYAKLGITNACPISEDISKRILCLPLYWTLPEEAVRKIAELVLAAI